MSQSLMAMLNIKRNRKDQEWTFEGTVYENIVKIFCREENLDFQDRIKGETTTEMFYEYPLLFDAWDSG
jgi:hypothetical protein